MFLKLQPHKKTCVINDVKEYEYQVLINKIRPCSNQQELISQLSELDAAINIRYVRANRKLIQDLSGCNASKTQGKPSYNQHHLIASPALSSSNKKFVS